MATAGDTVKFIAEFKDYPEFGSLPYDPQVVDFRLYSTTGKCIHSQRLSEGNRKSAGVYEVEVTLPKMIGSLDYEFVGNPEEMPMVISGSIVLTKYTEA